MADTAAGRAFSEDEMTAIIADRVQRETSSLTEAKAALENKLDVEKSAREAAEQRATAAESALADYKAEVQAREQAAQRKQERIASLRDAAPHLGDDFFTDEARVDRIIAMEDDVFAGYLGDLKATAATAPPSGGEPPRESAMKGEPISGTHEVASAAKAFFGRTATATKEG